MEPSSSRFQSNPLLLDDEAVERVLAGDPTVAEPYQAVVQLLSDARQISADLGDEALAVSTIMASASRHATGIRRGNRRSIGIRIAGISAGVALTLSGTAAAATGSLPEPAQRTIANTVAHAGIDIPKPNGSQPQRSERSPNASDTKTSSTSKATTTSTTGLESTATTPALDDNSGKPAEPTKTGQEHQSETGAEHSKGAENSEKSKSKGKAKGHSTDDTTTTTAPDDRSSKSNSPKSNSSKKSNESD